MKEAKSYYSIGEAAKAAGMTEETLRHYDRVGLVAEQKRRWTSYRYYTEQDVVRLNTVYALRANGAAAEEDQGGIGLRRPSGKSSIF